MSNKKENKTINKNIRFNYFEVMLVVDADIKLEVEKKKNAISKIKEKMSKNKVLTEKQQKLIDEEQEIIELEGRFDGYSASVWDMKPMLDLIMTNTLVDTSVDVEGIKAEIEPDSFHIDESLEVISFQLTKMRDYLPPAKKKIGEVSEEIKLNDDEYIGDFVSIIYDYKYSVLMVQSNNYGLSIKQIEKFLTQLRRRYLELLNDHEAVKELSTELRILVDPKKADRILDAKMFKKIKFKGSDFMLDALIDETVEGQSIMAKTRRLLGETSGINFEIVLSVNRDSETESLDKNEIEKLLTDFNKIKEQDNVPTLEITKKDNEDTNVEVVNLITPRLTDLISFKIEPRKLVGHEFLFEEMKETYKKTRNTVGRIISS